MTLNPSNSSNFERLALKGLNIVRFSSKLNIDGNVTYAEVLLNGGIRLLSVLLSVNA